MNCIVLLVYMFPVVHLQCLHDFYIKNGHNLEIKGIFPTLILAL